MNCIRQEYTTIELMYFFIQDKCAPEISLRNELYKSQFEKNLFANVLKDGKWGSYRHLCLKHSQINFFQTGFCKVRF